MIQDLIIFQKFYDFILWFYPVINKFPKKQRFVLGQQIQNEMIEILANMIEANFAIQKQPLLKTMSVNLDKLRILIRLSKDLHFISLRQYKLAAEKLNEVGRLLSGWMKKFSS